MDFELCESQILLQESVARFLAKHYDFAARRRIAADPAGMSREVWRGLADLGLLGATLPESVGGLEAGPVERAIIMEAFGRALLIEPYLAGIVLGAEAIVRLGSEAQQQALLPRVVAGEMLLAFAHAEPDRADLQRERATIAHREGDGWIIDGEKISVLGAPAADYILVSASVAPGRGEAGGAVFVVPRGAAGLSVDAYQTLDSGRAADITLRGVRVDDDALLGARNDCADEIEALLDTAVAALAADAIGAIDALMEATLAHARTRVQYGQPIGKFQVIQHKLADMAVLQEEARSLSLLATLSVEGPASMRARAASAAKIKIGVAAKQIAEHAVQIHGAMGVTDELNIGAYLKRALTFNLLLGKPEEHTARYFNLAREHDLLSKSLIEDAAAPPRAEPERRIRA